METLEREETITGSILHRNGTGLTNRWQNAILYSIFVIMGFVTYGYHYGWHNHGALIPALYRILDPSLLTKDIHASNFPFYIRAVTWVLAYLGEVVPLEALFALFQAVSMLVLFIAVRKWATLILPNQPFFGWLAIFVVITYRFVIPGENFVLGSWILFEMTPYMYTLGYAVWMLAVAALAERKIFKASILAAVTMYIQLNQGQQAVLLVAGALLLAEGSILSRVKNTLKFGLLTAVLAAPVVIGAFIDQMLVPLTSPEVGLVKNSFSEILRFRHRHHLQPLVWPLSHHLMFVAQIALTWYLFRLRKRIGWTEVDRVMARVFVVVVFLCGIGYANDILRIALIDKFYIFRCSMISGLITVLYGTWALWHFGLRKVEIFKNHRSQRNMAIALALYSVVAFMVILAKPELSTGRLSTVFPGLSFNLQQTPLEKYVQEQTPKDALILMAPDYINFAVNTQRSQVVNWMAVPYSKDDFREWYRRIVAVTDDKITVESMSHELNSFAIRDSVGVEYYRLPPARAVAIAQEMKADYMVFKRTLPLKPEFEWDSLAVYKVPPMSIGITTAKQ